MRALATATTIAAAFALTVAAQAGEPVGTYAVSGNNPGGGSTYSGKATVEKTGDKTYKVTVVVGKDTSVGTGLANANVIVFAYRTGSGKLGLEVLSPVGNNWAGTWVYENGTKTGDEVWTRK